MYKRQRYFKNSLPDYSTSGQNEGNCDFVQDLIKSYVQQIEQRFKPAPQNTDEGTGLYVGVAGIAFMFLKMACSKCFQEKRQELLAKAFTYIKVENWGGAGGGGGGGGGGGASQPMDVIY